VNGRAAYEAIGRTIETPMVIVTARAGERADGCLVGFSTQCSVDPVRYLVCLSQANMTCALARDAATLVVHTLHDDGHDRALARLFGEETAFETDKLSQCEWTEGPTGTPVLTGLDWFAGRILEQVDLGDHLGFVLDVGDGVATRVDEAYLSYRQVRDLDAGRDAHEREG
jgi:flavin reductase (DIM6/NTAB) family NADH-FMN oxidoreductase RutF